MIGSVTGVQESMAAEKRRKRKDREALTDAHAVAEAEMAGGRTDAEASKAITSPGVEAGPGVFDEPAAPPGPEAYGRPYLDSGHAARSPLSGPPNVSPFPPQGRGLLEPLPQSAAPAVVGNGPVVRAMNEHMARSAATMPTLRIPGRSA